MPSDPRGLDPRERTSPELRAWVALQMTMALAPREAAEALRASGDEPAAALRRSRAVSQHPTAREVERAREALMRAGARLVPLPSPHYPWRLARIADPAPVLSVIGRVEALSAPAVAMVGARAASAYGLGVARELSGALARAGLVIVSGLARGIDAAAHRGALAAGGRTVAVQACGPDRVYPPEHRRLAARIAERGALVSELPPGAPPRRGHFPLRNRLISGLAAALIVVEARERSGSLISVHHALAQGVEVFAVPGPITAATSAGSNRLLREGARPLLEPRDVLEVLSWPDVAPLAPARPEPDDPEARAILAALARAPASRDELARALSREPPTLAAALLDLELEGRIARDRDGRFRVIV